MKNIGGFSLFTVCRYLCTHPGHLLQYHGLANDRRKVMLWITVEEELHE
jgi:hypothetical protein